MTAGRPSAASAARPDGATVLDDRPDVGRVFTMRRRVRLGDVGPAGLLRLDGLARYLQDVAGEDSLDCALPDPWDWVVRRTLVEVVAPLALTDPIEIATWCQGAGPRWAERRYDVVGSDGVGARGVTLWVSIDPVTGGPTTLVPEFSTIWAEGVRRQVRARLLHDDPPPGAPRRPWSVRASDLDALGHVNNAATWAFVEQVAFDLGVPAGRVRASLEHHAPVEHGDAVEVALAGPGHGPGAGTPGAHGFRAWLVRGEEVIASAEVAALDPEPHR